MIIASLLLLHYCTILVTLTQNQYTGYWNKKPIINFAQARVSQYQNCSGKEKIANWQQNKKTPTTSMHTSVYGIHICTFLWLYHGILFENCTFCRMWHFLSCAQKCMAILYFIHWVCECAFSCTIFLSHLVHHSIFWFSILLTLYALRYSLYLLRSSSVLLQLVSIQYDFPIPSSP